MPRFSIVPYTYYSPKLMHLQFRQGNAKDPELFDREYRQQLDSLNAK
jgi:hypothetical protein